MHCQKADKTNWQKIPISLAKKFKLAELESNSIFTNRSIMDSITKKEQSLKKTQQNSQIKLITFNRNKHMQSELCRHSQRQNRKKQIKISQYAYYEKIRFKIHKRALTQPNQQIIIKQELSTQPHNPKLRITSKILQLTHQLSTNRADYTNYMKTYRKYSHLKCRSFRQVSQRSAYQTQNLSQCVNEKQQKTSSSQNIRNQQNYLEDKNHNLNLPKSRIKLKIKPGNYKCFPSIKRTRNLKEQNCELNKSIRGWTKYCRIADQIQQ